MSIKGKWTGFWRNCEDYYLKECLIRMVIPDGPHSWQAIADIDKWGGPLLAEAEMRGIMTDAFVAKMAAYRLGLRDYSEHGDSDAG